jgi:hypothetical protein
MNLDWIHWQDFPLLAELIADHEPTMSELRRLLDAAAFHERPTARVSTKLEAPTWTCPALSRDGATFQSGYAKVACRKKNPILFGYCVDCGEARPPEGP